MSEPPGYSLLKRSNGFWYVLHAKDGRMIWKSTRTRSKQDVLKSLINFRELLKTPGLCHTPVELHWDFLQYATGTYSPKTKCMYEACLENLKRFVGDL